MKYTLESYSKYLQQILPESNFILLDFISTERPCKIKCLTCNAEQSFTFAYNIARRARRNCKNVCARCEKNSFSLKYKNAQKEYKDRQNQSGIIPLQEVAPSNKENIEWKCTKCGNIFKRSPYVFTYHTSKCPICDTHAFKYTKEQILVKVANMWGTEYSVLQDEYSRDNDGKRRILVKHEKCGFIYSVNLYHFLDGQGCPHCKSSHGEQKVRRYLQQHNISFSEQYPILIEKSYLFFDFYIENENKKYAIEFNGIQHYKPVDFFGGEISFENQKKRDLLKEDYCKKNGIELIVIPYNNISLLESNELAQRLNGISVPNDSHPTGMKI